MQTPEERAFRQEALRLFDAPEGTEPKVTLYRDKAACTEGTEPKVTLYRDKAAW
ncbi:hypothetical protein T484DRAFT_1817662 [Baffinella frigidus]|nr:hypothetical protein T484DRAFT_1817662 [Cryptophyta sp. CCMP2293]